MYCRHDLKIKYPDRFTRLSGQIYRVSERKKPGQIYRVAVIYLKLPGQIYPMFACLHSVGSFLLPMYFGQGTKRENIRTNLPMLRGPKYFLKKRIAGQIYQVFLVSYR